MIFEPPSLLDHAALLGIAVPQVVMRAGPLQAVIMMFKFFFLFGMFFIPNCPNLYSRVPLSLFTFTCRRRRRENTTKTHKHAATC